MRTLITIAMLAALAACKTTPEVPNVPETVTVTVTKMTPVPGWATKPLRKPQASGDLVGDHLENEDARGHVIDLANCHRRLLAKLNAGEAVEESACRRP